MGCNVWLASGKGVKRMREESAIFKGILSSVGFGLVLAFPAALFANTAQSVVLFQEWATYSFYSIQVIALAVFAITSRYIADKMQNARGIIAVAALAGCGVVLGFVAQIAPSCALVLFLIGNVFSATGCSLITLCWMEYFSHMSVHRVAIALAGSFAISSLTQGILSFVSFELVVAFVLAVALPVSVLLLMYVNCSSQNEPVSSGETISYEWSFPLRPVVLYGMFIFAYKVSLNLLPEEDKSLAIAVGSFVGTIAVLAVLILRGKKFDIGLLYKGSLPLIVAGLLCIVEAGVVSPVVGVGTIVSARVLFAIFMITALCNICFRNGISAFWLFAIVNAITRVASLLANWTTASPLNGAGADTLYLFVIAVIVVLLCVFVAFMSNEGSEASWGIRPKHDEASPSVLDDTNALHKVARAYNLTLREEEVAFLRIRKLTIPQIMKELVVSQATVKSHINRIYKKTDTHSVEELTQLIEHYR